MIEIATGLAFLVSSLYGAGHANAETPASVASTTGEATTTETRPLTDQKDIERYIREEYAEEPILVSIARCESTFRQYDAAGEVIRGLVNPEDVGVMQINEKYHGERAAKLGYDIYDVKGNVAFAKYLYDKYGTQPWMSSSKCWNHSGDLARK